MEDDHEDKLVLDPNLKTADAFCQARKVNILSRKKKKLREEKLWGLWNNKFLFIRLRHRLRVGGDRLAKTGPGERKGLYS